MKEDSELMVSTIAVLAALAFVGALAWMVSL